MNALRRWITYGVLGGCVLVLTVPAAARPLAVGRAAPPFRLRTLDGRTLTNASFRGRTLVINVWGSWCPPCRMETSDLVAEATATSGGVAFIGVDTTETAAVVRAFSAAKGIVYPQIVTTSASAFARDYAIRNYPTTFVIDGQGVLRAQHADNVLPRRQLHAYIVAAEHGATATLVSDEQRKLDRLLDPARYHFSGAAPLIAANVRAAAGAIARAETEMDDAMTDPGRDHDLGATHAREQTLRVDALAALTPIAKTGADKALLARLRGDRSAAAGDWTGAESAYATALSIEPNDRAALASASYAALQRGDEVRAARLDERIAQIAPSFATEIGVARSQARLAHRIAAFAAIDRAVGLARAHGTPAQLAWTHLYGGRTAVQLSDVRRARVEFAAAASAAALISHENPRYAMYREEAQEADVGLTLGGKSKAGLSIAPWTGPELPGSIASTFKYRLAVIGQPARSVGLRVRGLPKGWIGSFCSDRLCSPFTTTVVVPRAGVKIVEFQVIPSDHVAVRPVVTIEAASDGERAAVSAMVTQ